MIVVLGRIIGKCTTTRFDFLVDEPVNKFGYCKVYHREYNWVLCQVVELEKTSDKVIAKSIIIGRKDPMGRIKQIRNPFDIGAEVHMAEDEFIRDIIKLDDENKGAYVGKLEGTNLPVYLDLNKLLTKHVAVLAKSGSGKSYSVGVLLEEIMEKNVPLLVIDPHGEYDSMKKENDDKKQIAQMEKFGIKPKSFARKIIVYGDSKLNPDFRPIRLPENLTPDELIDMLPAKLSPSQLGLLYSSIRDMESEEVSFTNIIHALQTQENNQKWNVINIIQYLKNLDIFSQNPIPFNELIQSGRCSILNFKGIDPAVQEIILYKLLKDLFMERKKNKIPPFFLVIEEAHNFVPEKGYSDAKCSKVIRTIASEGRKFGLGMCVVSQRPAIVQKTVLSQCTTQMILKITNPNDLKAVSNSVEGLTTESEDEIKNIPIGTAIITGIVDMPLFVNIRPRKTKHGGEAVDMLGMAEEENKFFDDIKDFKEQELMPIVRPNMTVEDAKLMSEPGAKVQRVLVPCLMFLCQAKNTEFNLLVDMVNGSIVQDIEDVRIKSAFLPELDKLSKDELKVLEHAFRLKKFSIADFVKKTGLSLDVGNVLNSLLAYGYLEFKGDEFIISERYILSDLSKSAFYKKIEFRKQDFEKKLEKKQRIDQLKAKLAKFTNVKDQRECWLLHYDVVV